MKHNYFSRKTRQLNLLVKKLNLALESGDKSQAVIERLKLRISLLLKELTGYFSKRQLKGILGSLAVIFGLTLNTNAQTFSAAVQNPFGITIANPTNVAPITSVDMDDDGDFDFFQACYYGSIDYFENTGTPSAPVFAAPVTNPFGLTSALTLAAPAAADMDNDGDMDLLVGAYSYYGGEIRYYQNTGTASAPAFAAPVINPFGLTSTYLLSIISVADIDGDGDTDILTGEYYGNLIYFQNTGSASSPAFAAQVANPFGLIPPGSTVIFPGILYLYGY